MFDVARMADFAVAKIKEFSADHQDETFYAFAIDASLLCLNSLEKHRESVADYRARWPDKYSDPELIADLRRNTGDWEYQGFAELTDDVGFDNVLYNLHYDEAMDADGFHAPWTEYARAMNELVEELSSRNAFDGLNTTMDFKPCWVEHNY